MRGRAERRDPDRRQGRPGNRRRAADPGSLAIIEATFQREDRGRAIGAWSALGGVAAAIGPLLGGWLIEAVSWRAIFFINLPIAAFVVWGAARHVPETRDPTITGRLDFPGSALASFALAGLTFTVIQALEDGLDSPMVLAALVVGLVSAVAFVFVERRSPEPMLPLSIFDSRQFSSANVVTFVVYAAMGGSSSSSSCSSRCRSATRRSPQARRRCRSPR